MVVPAPGAFEWHMNPSARPLFPAETWTLTCEAPEGQVIVSQQLAITRGQTVTMDPCVVPGQGLPDGHQPLDVLELPGVIAKVRATFNGRVYRVRVAGSLDRVADRAKVNPGDAGPASERCAGNVTITLRAKRKKVVSRKAAVDAECRYERTFRFGRRKLPKSLRKKGARIRLQALTHWSGNRFLKPADRKVTVRVKRR